MIENHRFTRVDFRRFKAFKSYSLHLRQFNILVGPNNAGKSTILTAFRILAAGIRRANQSKPVFVTGPTGPTLGYEVDLKAISVAEENIFYDYDESEAASVIFKLSNRGTLTLHFPRQGACHLIADDPEKNILTPKQFKSRFRCPIGFVPILGPVDHNEPLYEKEAARLALFNYRAARNFRNIWHHYPEQFETFRRLLQQTWPGMDIAPPQVDMSHPRPVLHMFCPEDRIPREMFWSGFGFQVWCQMLTHIVQSRDAALFLIDEPDIYLHSDLQRQLLGLLRSLGPDILIATHSTEIISEAAPDDIILIDKKRKSARRIKDPGELGSVFAELGSNLNPILTQLAKTRRAVFVEGKDFQILGSVARKLDLADVGNRRAFAVVPVEGFSPDRIRTLKRGIETTLGGRIAAIAILDKDYRSQAECSAIKASCADFCEQVIIHDCKEVENLLLVPGALDRAANRRVIDRAKRAGGNQKYSDIAAQALDEFAASQKSYVASQYVACRLKFERSQASGQADATAYQAALEEFEAEWADLGRRRALVSGKNALAFLNTRLQEQYAVSITPSGIVDAMNVEDIPLGMRELVGQLGQFAQLRVAAG